MKKQYRPGGSMNSNNEQKTKPDREAEILKRLEAMRAAIKSNKVAIVMHNNPDPDSIAGAFGLRLLLQKYMNVEAGMFYGGMIGRAENRCMINQLKIPMEDISKMDQRVYRSAALVDTQPGAGNNSLPAKILPDIVIDHHLPLRKKTRSVPFHDVRREAGSSSTIVTQYLMASGIRIPRPVATALMYGIKTDTYDLGREAGPEDVACYQFLLDKVDRTTINRIENPIHNRNYYIQLHRALESVEIYEDVCISTIFNVDYPDITAEIAEWFYFMWGIHWVLAIGVENDQKIYLSLRTRHKKRKAGTLINRVVGKNGTAGGHQQVAGGLINVGEPSREAVDAEILRLKKRILKSLGKKDDIKPALLINQKLPKPETKT